MTFHIAQINIARLVAAKDDPVVADFMNALDAVNAIADAAPGFVWRLRDDAGNATALQPTIDDRLIVNLSVWADIAGLSDFAYRSGHAGIMARRRDWMEPQSAATLALWPVAPGHRPSIDEGLARLWHLDRFGPSPRAFGFRDRAIIAGLSPADLA
jgi:hypothetical protein